MDPKSTRSGNRGRRLQGPERIEEGDAAPDPLLQAAVQVGTCPTGWLGAVLEKSGAHNNRAHDLAQVREKSARCSETMQDDDKGCKTFALVNEPFGSLSRRSATHSDLH
jgi:hypothetical protein